MMFSLNNSKFGEYIDRIYPFQLEIKDTTYTEMSASYIYLHVEIANKGGWRTKFKDKRDDFDFYIVNFPFMSSNITAAPTYGMYISQLIRYSRACVLYRYGINRGCCRQEIFWAKGFSEKD